MPYIEVSGSFPTSMKDSLAAGVSVPLFLAGEGKVFLTKEQAKRYQHAKSTGRKSIKVRMSPLQYRHNTLHGSGFFSDLWSGIKKVAGFLKSDVGKTISDSALDIASAVAPSYAGTLQGVKQMKKQAGYGVKKARKPRGSSRATGPKGKGVRAVGASGRGIIAV
jgi:hypothetical protein